MSRGDSKAHPPVQFRVSRLVGRQSTWLFYLPATPLAIIVLGFPIWFSHPFVVQMAIVVLFYAYVASCWNIVGGYAGQLSLAHPAFMGIGGYASTLLFIYLGLSPWLGMLVGATLSVLLCLPIGSLSFRLRGPYFALATLGFLSVVRIWIQNTEEVAGVRIGAAAGISVPLLRNAPSMFQFDDKASYYYVMLGLVVMIVLISHLVKKSRLGYYLRAIRDDEDAAESVGINTALAKLAALVISAFFTSLAGTYYAQLFRFVDPGGLMNLDLAFQMVLLTIVGGRGTVVGPVLGALLLRPLTELTNVYLGGSRFAGIHQIVLGILLIVVVLYQPRGLKEPLERLYLAIAGALRRPAGVTSA